MNVLTGVVLGGAVPIIGTLAFEQALPEFVWIDHFLTILLLCILCAAIGVLVNLPWNQGQKHQGQPATATPFEQPEPEYVFDAGFSGETFSQQEQTNRQHKNPKATTSFEMSRREAFRTLELELNADELQIREAFRRLAKEHHPDHAATKGDEAIAQASQKFQRVRAAYHVLLADGDNA